MPSFLPVIAALALLGILLAGVPAAEAQVFFASRPSPRLEVTPLFVVADVAPAADDVPVEVLFSLAIPPTRSALDFEQDLYLLWPGEVVGAGGKGDLALPPEIAAQVEVVGGGRLPMFAQRHFEAARDVEELRPGASFVTVVRAGDPLGLGAAATYVRIPWNWKVANQAWLVSVRFTARRLVKPRPTSWTSRMLSGPRNVLTLGFNDVSAPAMFSMYYWQRERVLPVASPARLVVNFPHADRLVIDALSPGTARRELRASRETEAVSLFLAPAEGLTPQVLRVEFGYLSGLQSWGPILVPALFFALGNVAAVMVRSLAEHVRRRLAGRLQVGRRRASAAELDSGVVVSRDRLGAIVLGETTYEEVVRLCGREMEEREGFGTPRRKILVYRGQREVPHRRWTWGWLAAVSHWDVERHEVEIALEDDVVQDIQMRVGRSRVGTR